RRADAAAAGGSSRRGSAEASRPAKAIIVGSASPERLVVDLARTQDRKTARGQDPGGRPNFFQIFSFFFLTKARCLRKIIIHGRCPPQGGRGRGGWATPRPFFLRVGPLQFTQPFPQPSARA